MAGTKRGAKAEATSPAKSAKAAAKDENAATPKTKGADGKVGTPKGKGSDGKTTTPKATKTKSKASHGAGGNGGKLPCVAQLPLTVALSFALSTLGSMVIAQVSRGELESLRRTAETRQELAIVAGWKIIELAVAWSTGLDSVEAAAMAVLSNGPGFYLLAAFYRLSPALALSALAVNVLSIAVPVYLVRPLTGRPAKSASSRDLLDIPMQLYASVLSTAIYTVTLVLSLRLILPRLFAVYFTGLPSLEPAYGATYVDVLPVTGLFGIAASVFIFAPFVATGKAKEDADIAKFDPVNASLKETVRWNFWGYTAKTKVVIRRTAIAAVLTAASTYLACERGMYGIDATGAAGYAGVWSAAAVFTGLGLGLVGRA